MGLWGWLDIYCIHHLRPWNTGRVGAIVWVLRRNYARKISTLIIIEMCCIHPRVCKDLPWYSISKLLREITLKGSEHMSSFSCVESVQKGVSKFLNFTVGNHLFTRSMM